MPAWMLEMVFNTKTVTLLQYNEILNCVPQCTKEEMRTQQNRGALCEWWARRRRNKGKCMTSSFFFPYFVPSPYSIIPFSFLLSLRFYAVLKSPRGCRHKGRDEHTHPILTPFRQYSVRVYIYMFTISSFTLHVFTGEWRKRICWARVHAEYNMKMVQCQSQLHLRGVT